MHPAKPFQHGTSILARDLDTVTPLVIWCWLRFSFLHAAVAKVHRGEATVVNDHTEASAWR